MSRQIRPLTGLRRFDGRGPRTVTQRRPAGVQRPNSRTQGLIAVAAIAYVIVAALMVDVL